MSHPLDEIVRILVPARRVLLLTHVHPDGDALGSQLGLGFILEAMGKEVEMYGEDVVSHLYDFLPGSDRLSTILPDVQAFDCGVALDCGDMYRLGPSQEHLLTLEPTIVIDHHAGHKEFGNVRWVDSSRASTGEMVFELARRLKAPIPYEAAYCLYAAIVSDTGSFKYSSTTAQTFAVARELVLAGVKPAEVAGKLFDNFTVGRLKLMQRVLDSLSLYDDQRIAMIFAPHEFFVETGTVQADAENFINFPRSIQSVRVAAFLKEPEKGVVSVSLRSKGDDCDVSLVAARFGGGGHRNAAGFKRKGVAMDAVREELLGELRRLLGGG